MSPLVQTSALMLLHYVLALGLGACAYFILFPKKWCIFVTKAKTWAKSHERGNPPTSEIIGEVPCTTEVVTIPPRKKETKSAEPVPKSKERTMAIAIYKDKLSTHYRNLGATLAEFQHCWHAEAQRLAFLEVVPECIPKRHDIKKIKNVRGPSGMESGSWMIEKLTKVLRKKQEFNNDHWKIRLYGSMANGFAESQSKGCTHDSDVDCSFIMDPNVMAALDISLEKLVEVATEENTFICSHLALTAKVPVACLKIGDNVMDITVNNHLAIRNTALLREYSEMHPCVKELVLAVKCWAKENKLTNAGEGKFSSYSWTIMVLVYLQLGCSFGKILPSLQELAPEGKEFQTAAEAGKSSMTLPSMPTLLQDFLHWLAYRVDKTQALSLREAKLISPARQSMFFRWDVTNIEDPFEIRNLNVVVSAEQAEIFRNTVRRAADSMAEKAEAARIRSVAEVCKARVENLTMTPWPPSRQENPQFSLPYVPASAAFSWRSPQEPDLRFPEQHKPMDTLSNPVIMKRIVPVNKPKPPIMKRIILSTSVDAYRTLTPRSPPGLSLDSRLRPQGDDLPFEPRLVQTSSASTNGTVSDAFQADAYAEGSIPDRSMPSKKMPIVVGKPLVSNSPRPAVSALRPADSQFGHASESVRSPVVGHVLKNSPRSMFQSQNRMQQPDLSSIIQARRSPRNAWSWRSSGTEVYLTGDIPEDAKPKDDAAQSSTSSSTQAERGRHTLSSSEVHLWNDDAISGTDDDEIMVSAPVMYT